MSTKDPKQKDGGVATVTRTEKKQQVAKPRLYKVVFHNDDYTTMEFVVAVLQHLFHHSEASATAIMLHVHRNGVGIAGVYTFEIAETKAQQARELAQKNEFPLQVTVEPEEGDDRDDGGQAPGG
jgi:ATP-dependent Clp protease adaptor protein ClpS